MTVFRCVSSRNSDNIHLNSLTQFPNATHGLTDGTAPPLLHISLLTYPKAPRRCCAGTRTCEPPPSPRARDTPCTPSCDSDRGCDHGIKYASPLSHTHPTNTNCPIYEQSMLLHDTSLNSYTSLV